MKKNKIIIALSLFLMLPIVSCNDWLTVTSEEEILEEDAFSSKEGYRSALIGAYMLAAKPELWGKELTWGFMSALSRNYNTNYLPYTYNSLLIYENFEAGTNTKGIITNIWNTAYKVIANCNNILKNIENTDNSFFEYSWERDMIISEARALRALMHFEMMRLFVPAPITGYSGLAVPYVRDYPVIAPPFNTMEEVFQYVIEDLEFAQDKLRYIDVDVIFGESTMNYFHTMLFWGIQNIKPDGERGNGAGFFSFRGYRMNYWGVTALLARVYSYKRENAKAVEYIDKLLEEFGQGLGIAWSGKQYSDNPNEIDGKRVPEPLVSLWNSQACTIYETALASRTNCLRVIPLDELFGEDVRDDYRYIGLYNSSNLRYRVWDRANDPAYVTNKYVLEYSNQLLPILELSELIYIRCEYYIELGRLDDAIAQLKNVKNKRNVTSPIEAENAEQLMEVLINDHTRDYLTRGQTWHYLKKLNWKKMYNGTDVPWDVPDHWFVLPLPDSEINFM